MTENSNPLLIEHRYAGVSVNGVDFKQRIITVIVVPYEQPAQIEYRSELWNEWFMRGALNDVTPAPHRVRVNRGHNKDRTVGKMVNCVPEHIDGFLADMKIAKTELGDETLALAEDDCLSASAGFGVRPGDQVLDRKTMTRIIKKAYLDHVSLVESPAYAGARVLSVRDTDGGDAARLEPIRTPNLDQAVADEQLRWASEYLNKK